MPYNKIKINHKLIRFNNKAMFNNNNNKINK